MISVLIVGFLVLVVAMVVLAIDLHHLHERYFDLVAIVSKPPAPIPPPVLDAERVAARLRDLVVQPVEPTPVLLWEVLSRSTVDGSWVHHDWVFHDSPDWHRVKKTQGLALRFQGDSQIIEGVR